LTVGLSVANCFFDYSSYLTKNKPYLRKSRPAACENTVYIGLKAFYFCHILIKILIEVQNINLIENLSVTVHLKTCGRTDVTKLIVDFRFAISLSRPVDSTGSL
jgi:hypothetical protein